MRTSPAAVPGPIWRKIIAPESALLAAAVKGNREGASELRSQLPGLLARPGCSCGCGTIDLLTRQGRPAHGAPSPAPCEGTVLDVSGQVAGGLMLFFRDGFLLSLEIYSYGDPLPLPTPDRVQWGIVNR